MLSDQPGVDLEAAVPAPVLRWRAAHPQATLTEIDLAVEAAVQRLRAQYLAGWVAPPPDTARVTDGAAVRCAHCGGARQPRGQRTRGGLPPGQPDPGPLARPYCVCTRCGAGGCPPG